MHGPRARPSGAVVIVLALSPLFALAQGEEKKSGPERSYPHRVTGEALEEHFRGDWEVEAVTGRAVKVTFYNNADGTVRIQPQNMAARVPHGYGTRELHAADNELCLDIATTTWRAFSGCYRLLETGPRAYSLRGAKSQGPRFDYRR